MSILSKIVGFVTGIPGDIKRLAEGAWNAVVTVWSWATSIAKVLDDAWLWVVHGVEWFAGQVGSWAGWVFGNLWQLITKTIPGAITWVFGEAAHFAGLVATRVWNWAKVAVRETVRFASKLAHDLVNALRAVVNAFVRYATDALKWVYHWGDWVVKLLSHPENIANWIAGAIVEPVVKWLIRSGVNVVVWLIRRASELSTEFAATIEDAIAKVL